MTSLVGVTRTMVKVRRYGNLLCSVELRIARMVPLDRRLEVPEYVIMPPVTEAPAPLRITFTYGLWHCGIVPVRRQINTKGNCKTLNFYYIH